MKIFLSYLFNFTLRHYFFLKCHFGFYSVWEFSFYWCVKFQPHQSGTDKSNPNWFIPATETKPCTVCFFISLSRKYSMSVFLLVHLYIFWKNPTEAVLSPDTLQICFSSYGSIMTPVCSCLYYNHDGWGARPMIILIGFGCPQFLTCIYICSWSDFIVYILVNIKLGVHTQPRPH